MEKYKNYWELEYPFLSDWLFFGSKVRYMRSKTNDTLFQSGDELSSRVGFLGVYEIYNQAIESLAATCLAIKRRFPNDSSLEKVPVSYTVTTYSGGSVKLLRSLGVTLVSLQKRFPLEYINSISKELDKFTQGSSSKIKEEIYRNLLSLTTECSGNNGRRIRIYNKIKHFGCVFPYADRFKKTLGHVPAVIHETTNKEEEPEIYFPEIISLKYTSDEYELMQQRTKNIELIQQDLIGMYLIHSYEKELSADIKPRSAYELFQLL